MNTVCKKCDGALRAGYAISQAEEAKANKTTLFRLTSGWPGFYLPSDDRKVSDNLSEAFHKLSRVALRSVPSKKDPYDKDVLQLPPQGSAVHYQCTYDSHASIWAGTKRLADAITLLDLCVRRAIAEALKVGEETGSNLLFQLAEGKISINQLSEAHIEAGRRRRED